MRPRFMLTLRWVAFDEKSKNAEENPISASEQSEWVVGGSNKGSKTGQDSKRVSFFRHKESVLCF